MAFGDMKRFYFLFLACMALSASAEVITMDLATATDATSTSIVYSTQYGTGYYDCTDVWNLTYDDSAENQYLYTNEGHFMLSHLPSQNAYGGMSWEGFTLSKVSQDTANVFGCVANGGVAGIGTPYAIGYFSEWVTESLGWSSNLILFDQEYYPEYVYICQNSNTMRAITHGDVFNARAFTQHDTLALIISTIDQHTFRELQSTTYYLAVDGEKNSGWVKVPLYMLGKTTGLSFRMTTTDTGSFGANTPLYFALDGLTVNTQIPTAVKDIEMPSTHAKKVWNNGQWMIIRGNDRYTILGTRL